MMIALRFMGAWIGSAALLLGVLWFCSWRTERRIRKQKIMDQVLWKRAGEQYLEGPDPKWKSYNFNNFPKDC